MKETTMTQTTIPKLQPPGAGIPLVEKWGLRHLWLPTMQRRLSWDVAQSLYANETARVLDIYRAIPVAQRATPILINRLRGLEDSSRFWSADQTLEHMMIVSQAMTKIIQQLTAEQKLYFVVSTADVKPNGRFHGDDMDQQFADHCTDCLNMLQQVEKRNSCATHVHPWFGRLNAHGWHTLFALHHRVHRNQLALIASGLA